MLHQQQQGSLPASYRHPSLVLVAFAPAYAAV